MSAELLIDWDEMFEYLPGTAVELKSNPGILRQINCYEVMMVPPIWLIGDPRPRYPSELRIISRRAVQTCELEVQQRIWMFHACESTEMDAYAHNHMPCLGIKYGFNPVWFNSLDLEYPKACPKT